jgi:hypothetical protein
MAGQPGSIFAEVGASISLLKKRVGAFLGKNVTVSIKPQHGDGLLRE